MYPFRSTAPTSPDSSLALRRSLRVRIGSATTWDEAEFTGTGFPNHFYLRYNLYRHYFPLMALGRFMQGQLAPDAA